jgi:hypothetical protein
MSNSLQQIDVLIHLRRLSWIWKEGKPELVAFLLVPLILEIIIENTYINA